MKSVEGKGLVKKFGETMALDKISFSVDEGELFGFIGPDGAGKTTLFRILTTLLIPTEGEATIVNYDAVKDYMQIRKRIGYMPGRFSLYQDLTVEENIKFFATIFGTTVEENYHLVKPIYSQIEPFKKRKAGQLSGGMKQKLALSCALIHKPRVLFLDEPTTGVDPVSRNEFWEMLNYLQEQGITIVVSTPYMDEASLCDRVALIQKGKIMKTDTPENIVKDFPKKLAAIRGDNMYGIMEDMRKYPDTGTIHTFGDYLHYTDKGKEPELDKIENYLSGKGHKDTEVKIIKPGIEDSFMELMEEDGRE